MRIAIPTILACGLATFFALMSLGGIVGVITVEQSRAALAIMLPVVAAFSIAIYVLARRAARE